jgi:hypothetical protein
MSGHGWDAQARASVEINTVGQTHGALGWNYGQFGRGAAWPIPRRFVHPHALSDALGRHTGANGLNLARTVLVRDDPRERHGRLRPAASVGI